jgi:acetoin utilization protein AcuB
MMLVSELMTPQPKTLDVTGTVREAVALLADLDVRHLPIMEGQDLVGIVSDRDLRELLGPESDDPEQRARRLDAPVTSAMSSDVLFVGPEDDIGDVIDLMIENRLGAVPVLTEDPRELVGMVSYVDILREAKGVL